MSRLQLEQLGAVVFAATRTLAEFTAVQHRTDLVTVWGLGCHPGLSEAVAQFHEADFGRQLHRTAFVGEVGLDGDATAGHARQEDAGRSTAGSDSSRRNLLAR